MNTAEAFESQGAPESQTLEMLRVQDLHAFYDFNAWRVFGYQDLALGKVAIAVVWVGLAHHDKDLGALVGGVGDKPFFTVNHKIRAIFFD